MATLLQEAAQLVIEDSSLGELIDNALDVSDNAAGVSIVDAPVSTFSETEVLVDILDVSTGTVDFNNTNGSPIQVPTIALVPDNAVVPSAVDVVVNDISVDPGSTIACIDYPLALVQHSEIPEEAPAIAAPLARPVVPMGILPIEEFVDPLLDTVPEDGFVDPLLDIIAVDEFVDPLLDTVPVDEFVETKPLTLEGVVDAPATSGARLAGPFALGAATLMIDVPPADEGVDPLLDTVPVEDFVDPLLDIMPVGEGIVIDEADGVVQTRPLTLDGFVPVDTDISVPVPTDNVVMVGDAGILPDGTFDPCVCFAAPLTDPVVDSIGSGSVMDYAAPPDLLLVDYAAPTGFIVDYAAPPVI
jgi:hypothetical protein